MTSKNRNTDNRSTGVVQTREELMGRIKLLPKNLGAIPTRAAVEHAPADHLLEEIKIARDLEILERTQPSAAVTQEKTDTDRDHIPYTQIASEVLETDGEIASIPLAKIRENKLLQPRLKILDTDVQEMSESLKIHGQQDRIQVRAIQDQETQEIFYEIISGHTRYRGAILGGLPTIKAEIVKADDNQALIASLVANEARTDLSDYERALSYQKALTRRKDDGVPLISSQRELSKFIKKSHGRISQCIQMLNLPSSIREILDERPNLFGYRTADELLKLLVKHPDKEGVILQAVQRVVDGSESNSIKSWVEQKIASSHASTMPEATVLNDAKGKKVFITKAKKSSVVVEWPHGFEHDRDKIQRTINEALRKYIEDGQVLDNL